MQTKQRFGTSLAAAAALLAMSAPATATGWTTHQWDQASSLGRTALVIGTIGVPAVQNDWTSTGQSALAIGGASAVTGILKYSIHETRPDGSDSHSFPSGHTSASFAAAASLEQRYGWKVGIPAHLLAAFVGLARVEADRHYWQDVVVGAAIGEAAGLLLGDHHHHERHMLVGEAPAVSGVGFAIRF